MRSIRLRVTAPLAVISLLIAACGGPEPEGEGAQPAPEAPTQQQATETGAAEGAATAAADFSQMPVEEIAVYEGEDRLERLESCAAQEEGPLLIYTSSILDQAARPLSEAFQVQYPDIAVEFFRAGSVDVAQRLVEEARADVNAAGVLETTLEPTMEVLAAGLLTPYTFSSIDAYPEDSLAEGYMAPSRESYRGLGFNTDLYSREEVPQTFEELLDPKWKGVVSIAGSSGGARWIGGLLHSHGEDFVRQFGEMDWNVQNVSARALADLIISGEVPMSPTIADAHVVESKETGAPIDWVPLEPAVANVAVWSLPAATPQPCQALLYIDFAYSEEGQQIYTEAGYNSAHEALKSEEGVEALYLELITDDYAAEYEEWQRLVEELFVEAG